jgi:hypothetical protein
VNVQLDRILEAVRQYQAWVGSQAMAIAERQNGGDQPWKTYPFEQLYAGVLEYRVYFLLHSANSLRI